MKTLQLKTLPFLLVELSGKVYDVPAIVHNVLIEGNSSLVIRDEHGFPTFHKLNYGAIKTDTIGKLTELPDEWFDKIMKMDIIGYSSSHRSIVYRNYKNEESDTKGFTSSKHSFQSLLQAKEQVYLGGNPAMDKPENYDLWLKYGDYTQYGKSLSYKAIKYNEAQSRTFDPERTYIFQIKTT